MAWLRLVRWKNLLIVLLTQLLAWWCIIVPVQKNAGIHFLLNPYNFLLLTISTILITAAGYIINDYFDIKIDRINRPDKMVLEKQIPRRLAIIMHTVLNVAGILLAAFVAKQAHHYEWVLLQIGCTLLLWFYSTHFKRQLIIGNVAVALLTALTIVVLIMYEPAIRYYAGKGYFISISDGLSPNPLWILIIYAYFAFMLTWMREIVKDMEDYKGDAQEGCITMPIKWGLLPSIKFIQTLGILVMLPLFWGAIKLMGVGWWILGTYIIAGIVSPLLIWIYRLQREATVQHYHNASRQIKNIMLLGIGSLIIYYFQVHA